MGKGTSEAAELIAQMRGQWGRGSQRTIADALGVDPKMVRKVEGGASSGAKYLPTLRALAAGRPAPLVDRGQGDTGARLVIDRQGRLVASGVASGDLRRVLRNASRRRDPASRRVAVTVTGTDRDGNTRTATIWSKGGRDASDAWKAIVAELEALGIDPNHATPADISAALAALVADAEGQAVGADGVSGLAIVSVVAFGVSFVNEGSL